MKERKCTHEINCTKKNSKATTQQQQPFESVATSAKICSCIKVANLCYTAGDKSGAEAQHDLATVKRHKIYLTRLKSVFALYSVQELDVVNTWDSIQVK